MTNFITTYWIELKTIICSLILVIVNIIPLLVCIAFFVVSERKVLGALQRRFGPNMVGYWGLLQAAADGLKLICKEMLVPARVNIYLYFLAPVAALFFTFFAWGFIPLSLTATFFDDVYSVLVILAISSLNVYTIMVAGWSSNSKYSFLGGLRSSAQMISYEVSISICLLPVFLSARAVNLIEIVSSQKLVFYILPLAPVALIFFISIIAETNRAPFDLPEAEAELVAGFNLEYASIIFAFFFLAEYGNIILMSAFFSILFLGGWLAPFEFLAGTAPVIWMSIKTVFCCFFFLLVRGTLPRYRYDQLMYIGWKVFLPISLSFFFFYTSWLFYLNGVALDFFDFQNLNLHNLTHYIIKPQVPSFLNEPSFIKNIVLNNL